MTTKSIIQSVLSCFRWASPSKYQETPAPVDAVALCYREGLTEVEVPRKNDKAKSLIEPCRWLRENIGPQGIAWDIKLGPTYIPSSIHIFIFLEETDAAAFKLAWTGGI